MRKRNKGCHNPFNLDDVRDISVGELITVAVGTQQSLRMIIDNSDGEPVFALLLLNMGDYDKWSNLLSGINKP